jgi:hypothetical protein
MKNDAKIAIDSSLIAGPITLEISLPKGARPPAEIATFFQMAHTGSEIQMLVGYIDPQIVAARAQQELVRRPGGGEIQVKIEPELTHRFSISPQGFAMLRASVDLIVKSTSRPG